MSNTTKIDVLLKNPNGWPIVNSCFSVKPVRTGFLESDVSLIEDRELIFKTDDKGYCQMELLPLAFPYVMTYTNDVDDIPGYFMFYVPEIDTTVQFKDLVVQNANPDTDYSDKVLAQIVAAKAQVSALVQQAQASQAASAVSAGEAQTSAFNAHKDAVDAEASRDNVAQIELALQGILNQIMSSVVKVQAIQLQNKLLLGNYQIWVDPAGKLRIMAGTPTTPTSGTVVGDQTS